MAKLVALHDRAAAKGDERAALDALKELRQLNRQEIDVLRDLGAFQAFRVTTMQEREEADENSLPFIARNFMRMMNEELTGNGPGFGREDDEIPQLDLEAIEAKSAGTPSH